MFERVIDQGSDSEFEDSKVDVNLAEQLRSQCDQLSSKCSFWRNKYKNIKDELNAVQEVEDEDRTESFLIHDDYKSLEKVKQFLIERRGVISGADKICKQKVFKLL